jgi:hypothetical protein
MLHSSLRIAAFAASFVPCVCLAQNSVTITLGAKTVVEGQNIAVTADAVQNGKPAPNTVVTFSVNQCGAVNPAKPVTPLPGAVAPPPQGQVQTQFTGGPLLPLLPFTPCIAKVGATTTFATDTAEVTVTPKPVTLEIPGTVAPPARGPLVSITPTVLIARPTFTANYYVVAPRGYDIMKVFIVVEANSTFSTTDKAAKINANATTALVTMTPPQKSITVTIKSEKGAGGNATFEVFTVDTATNKEALTVKFTKASQPLPGPL